MTGIRALVRDQSFAPGFLGLFVNPFFIARNALWTVMAQLGPKLGGALLDVGCGSSPYRELFHCETYTGMDIDSPDARSRGVADVFYDGRRFPQSSQSVGSVVCTQVLEHVFEPDAFLTEVARVLVPGGQLLLTVPFVWDEHEQPWDFARYSSFGVVSLLQRNGFRVIEQRKLAADSSLLFQLANAYLYKMSLRWPRWIRILGTVTIGGGLNIFGLVAGKLLPANPDLYLDNVVLAEKC